MKKSLFQNEKRKVQIACLTLGLLCSGFALSEKSTYAMDTNTVLTGDILRETAGSQTSTTPTPGSSASVSPSTTPTPIPQTSIQVTMNYQTGRVTYAAGAGGSTKFYLSTNKKKTWELLDVNPNSIDLNGLMKSSDVKLYFKGNKDQNPVELVLKGEVKGLKAAYSVVGGAGKITLTGAVGKGGIEYRIGKDGNWTTWVENSFQTAPYEITGITLQFREKATISERSGKIVSLKIPKRPTPPSVKVDGDKFVLTGMKNNTMQYRVNNGQWITYIASDGKSKYLDIRSLLAPGTTDNSRIPAGTIEIRTMATEKKVASAIRTIEIEQQQTAPTSATVELNGTTLTCKDASATKQYEYTMLHVGEVLDMQKAKWTTIRSSKSVLIKKTGKAETIVGDVMVIRVKLEKDSVTKEEGLPSQYLSMQITSVTPK